jgi:DNA (cytosine-5)-methyltransferase 1
VGLPVYFNENDVYPAQWLRNLFPGSVVDERSIVDVESVEYERAHFFAGIGGWEYALQLAGWPKDKPVWSGSCPCQPFSCAGKRKGVEDERHLWPQWLRIIAQSKPAVCFGEQVASPDGRKWFAGVRSDMEALGYAVGCADLCVASIGAPHARQRLYWVAHRYSARFERSSVLLQPGQPRQESADVARSGCNCRDRLAHGCSERRQQNTGSSLSDEGENGRRPQADNELAGSQQTRELGDTEILRDGTLSGQPGSGNEPQEQIGRSDLLGGLADSDLIESCDRELQRSWGQLQPSQNTFAQWGTVATLCADGKYRRVEPSILPVAHGISNRVGRIRAYGNSICAPTAAMFIRAFMEVAKI